MNAYVCVCVCVVHFWGVGRSIILFWFPSVHRDELQSDCTWTCHSEASTITTSASSQTAGTLIPIGGRASIVLHT